MKAKLLTLPEGIVAVKTQDTVTLKEPLNQAKRYIVLQHSRKGIKEPYLLPDSPFNILERANLVSDVYEVLASTIEGVGKELKIFAEGEEICPIESAYEFKEYEYTETETELIIEI